MEYTNPLLKALLSWEPKASNQVLGVNDNGMAPGFYVDAAANTYRYVYDIGAQTFTRVSLPSADKATSGTAIRAARIASRFGFVAGR